METETPELAGLLAREHAIRQETEILRDANIALTQNLSLERVLETLLDFLARLVPYDSANVVLCNSEWRFVIRALRPYEGYQNIETMGSIIFAGEKNALLRRIYTREQSLIVPDTYSEPEWEFRPGADHVRNWMGVPLVTRSEEHTS